MKLTIGQVAKQTGLSTKTIRFYEAQGLLPTPGRTDSGYRLYFEADLVRLRLVKSLRLLGLSLPAVRVLVDQALSADCALFGDNLAQTIATQQEQVETRLAELGALKEELESLQAHLQHCCDGCSPEDMAMSCDFCGLISDGKEVSEHEATEADGGSHPGYRSDEAGLLP